MKKAGVLDKQFIRNMDHNVYFSIVILNREIKKKKGVLEFALPNNE